MDPPDLVFSSVDTRFCSSTGPVSLHEILEDQKIPFVGSSADCLQKVRSKTTLKETWRAHGVPTPAFWSVQKSSDIGRLLAQVADSDFPLIVKPSHEGNSRGIDDRSVVVARHELSDAVERTLSEFGEVLVEQFLGNDPHIREFTVAQIGQGPNGLRLPTELILKRIHRNRVITTQDKESGSVETRALEDPVLALRLQEFSSKAFEAAGVRDYARCDILMVQEQLYALEINGQPMVPDPWFQACAAGAGLSESQYLAGILWASIQRQRLQLSRVASDLPIVFQQLLPDWAFERLTAS